MSPSTETIDGSAAPKTRLRVLVVDPLAESALRELDRQHDLTVRQRPPVDEFHRLLTTAEILVLRSGVVVDERALEGAINLQVIARAGAGYDNIDLDACRARGLTVFNIPGASSSATAELAITLAFAAARGVIGADAQVRHGRWDKAHLVGRELGGSTAGVVGLGNVGGSIARVARALGMQVIATVANPSADRRERAQADGIELVGLEELLSRSAFVFLAVPLSRETRGLIDEQRIGVMRDRAILVNVSRGGVVDENAVSDALREGRLAAAGFDVHAGEGGLSLLADAPNVVLTPHIGAMTHEAQERVGDRLLDALSAAIGDGDVPNRLC